jgi:photosystem II stability/assembly factor-like uncharacterized protein
MFIKKLFFLFSLFLVFPARTGLLISSPSPQDDGWVPLSVPQAPGGNVIALAQSPSTPEILYTVIGGNQGGRFFRSQDAGLSWQERHIFTLVAQYEVRGLVVDPENASVVYANGFAGMQRSLDGGDTWETIYPLGDVFAAVSSNLLYAGGPVESCGIKDHIFHLDRSQDGGKTWQSASLGCLDQLEQIAVLPSQPDVVYVSAFVSGSSESTILKSTDSGQTWETYALPLQSAYFTLIIDPADPQRLFSAGYGISRSLDGGQTWELISTKTMGGFYHLALSSGSLFAIESTNFQAPVYRSDDDGANWWITLNQLPAGASAILADPTNSDRFWAGLVNYGIYHTTNRWSSWNERNEGIRTPTSINTLAISPSDPSVMYAATDAPYPGIYRTEDGGMTWGNPLQGFTGASENNTSGFRPFSDEQNAGISLPLYPISPIQIYKLLVHPLHPEIAWAATSNGIYQTTNGSDWQLGLSIGIATDVVVSKADPDHPFAALFDLQANIPYVAQWRCDITPFPCIWWSIPISTGLLSIDVIRTDPVDPSHLLSEGIVYTSTSKALAFFQSLNSGASWQQIGMIDLYAILDDLVINYPRKSVMEVSLTEYISGQRMVYRSLDGGVTWDDWSTGLPASQFNYPRYPLAVDELGSTYEGTVDGVYTRQLNDPSWSTYGLQGNLIRALVYRSGTAPALLAVTSDGLWRHDLSPIQRTWLPLIGQVVP